MDKQIQQGVDYKKLYTDMIAYQYPDLLEEFKSILSKENIISFDILMLQNKILSKAFRGNIKESQKFRSYDEATIKKILKFQKTNKLSNNQVALHFKLSRNTIAKWKKIFD